MIFNNVKRKIAQFNLNKLICIHYLNYLADGYYSTGLNFHLQI
jgi:hypothetical protein